MYLLYGQEKYLIQEFIRYLTQKCIEPDHRDFAVSKFDLSEMPVDAVLEDAETLPFLVPRKLIIAKDAVFFTGAKDSSKIDHDLDRLMQYLQSPVDFTVLVFTVQAEKLDERKKLVKYMKEKGWAVPFLTLSSEELSLWVKRQAEQAGAKMADDAADALIRAAGTHLQTLSMEIEKLSMYCGAGGVIDAYTVERLVPRGTEQNVFLLIEEMVQLRLDRALSILYDLLKQREEPVKLLALMARQFRLILQVKELSRQGYTQQQTASAVGAHPYAVKIAADQGRRYEEARLRSILTELAELDYRMKSGTIDKVLAMELFLLKLGTIK